MAIKVDVVLSKIEKHYDNDDQYEARRTFYNNFVLFGHEDVFYDNLSFRIMPAAC